MAQDFIAVDLTQEEKSAVLKYAGFYITDQGTKADLANARKKWIRFRKYELSNAIGELSYTFNRCGNDFLFHFLDELIGHLEYYERQAKE